MVGVNVPWKPGCCFSRKFQMKLIWNLRTREEFFWQTPKTEIDMSIFFKKTTLSYNCNRVTEEKEKRCPKSSQIFSNASTFKLFERSKYPEDLSIFLFEMFLFRTLRNSLGKSWSFFGINWTIELQKIDYSRFCKKKSKNKKTVEHKLYMIDGHF